MNEFLQMISTLLASRTQAHIFHWQTQGVGSEAAHEALGEYYEGIGDIVDSLVESFQGRYGIQKGYTSPAAFREDGQYVMYFKALTMYVETIRKKIPQDSYLQNKVDEIVDFLESTNFKLQNLH